MSIWLLKFLIYLLNILDHSLSLPYGLQKRAVVYGNCADKLRLKKTYQGAYSFFSVGLEDAAFLSFYNLKIDENGLIVIHLVKKDRESAWNFRLHQLADAKSSTQLSGSEGIDNEEEIFFNHIASEHNNAIDDYELKTALTEISCLSEDSTTEENSDGTNELNPYEKNSKQLIGRFFAANILEAINIDFDLSNDLSTLRPEIQIIVVDPVTHQMKVVDKQVDFLTNKGSSSVNEDGQILPNGSKEYLNSLEGGNSIPEPATSNSGRRRRPGPLRFASEDDNESDVDNYSYDVYNQEEQDDTYIHYISGSVFSGWKIEDLELNLSGSSYATACPGDESQNNTLYNIHWYPNNVPISSRCPGGFNVSIIASDFLYSK